jgi:hypothetical protein
MVVRMRLRLTKGDEDPAKLDEGGITAERVNLASLQYCGWAWSRVDRAMVQSRPFSCLIGSVDVNQ